MSIPTVSRKGLWLRLGLATLALAGLATAWRYTPLANLMAPERLLHWSAVVGDTWWAHLLIIVAYTPAAFALFPRPMLTLFSVMAFGPWLGPLYSLVGILCAALASYFAGRAMGWDSVHRLGGERADQAAAVLRRHGVLTMFAANQVPAPPFVVKCMIAGAIRMKIGHYVAGSLLGMAPGLLAAGVFANEIRAAIEGTADLSYAAVAAALAALTLAGYVARRWYARPCSANPSGSG